MDLMEREAESFFHTYERLPLEVERGEGMYLFGADGIRYLDMFSGVAVNALGHCHPGVVAAIRRQAGRSIHVSNYYLMDVQIRLAELLRKHSGYQKVFLANSGTEAMEGAIKIARKWGAASGKCELVALSNAFHGRTLGSLSLMDRAKYRAGYEPLLGHTRFAALNDPASLETVVSSSTAAVALEFIQGEGGIRPVSAEFVERLVHLRDRFGFLVIADEIQSGLGRTGRMFAFDHCAVRPDVVAMAKPIGGGLPLGAVLGNNNVATVLGPGGHGTTFGGNPVACAAGCVVVEEVMERGGRENAEAMGRLLRQRLLGLQEEMPAMVKDVRGLGLMLGMELHRDAGPIVTAMRERNHILINATDQTVLRFLPPLIVGPDHIDTTIQALRDALLTIA